MSSLVDHAQKELTLRGDDGATIADYLSVIQAFADARHSGGSASVAIPTLQALLQYQNLTPLTTDIEDWEYRDATLWGGHGEGIWQSRRNPEAFSTDSGKTHYLLSEDSRDAADKVWIHTIRETKLKGT